MEEKLEKKLGKRLKEGMQGRIDEILENKWVIMHKSLTRDVRESLIWDVYESCTWDVILVSISLVFELPLFV